MSSSDMAGLGHHKRITPVEISNLKRRVRNGDNVQGAVYKLCTALQPSTFEELRVAVYSGTTKLTAERFDQVADGWLQWREAGCPGMLAPMR